LWVVIYTANLGLLQLPISSFIIFVFTKSSYYFPLQVWDMDTKCPFLHFFVLRGGDDTNCIFLFSTFRQYSRTISWFFFHTVVPNNFQSPPPLLTTNVISSLYFPFMSGAGTREGTRYISKCQVFFKDFESGLANVIMTLWL